MRKIIGIVCLSLFALTSNAQDLKGTWKLDEVAKQTLAATKTTTIAAENGSRLASETPVTMVFENGSFCFTYMNGSTLQGGYFTRDGILHVGTPDKSADYKLIEQNGRLSIELANRQVSSFNKVEE